MYALERQVKYMKRTKGYRFRAWDSYIMESAGISQDDDDVDNYNSFIIRKEPSINADTIFSNYQGGTLCPLEVKGDWVKIIYNCSPEGTPCTEIKKDCNNPKTGWVRWKKKNEVLVVILLAD